MKLILERKIFLSKTNSSITGSNEIIFKPKPNLQNKMDKNFQRLLDINDSPALIVDKKNGNILAANKAALNFCGCTRQRLISKKFNDLFISKNKKLQKISKFIFENNTQDARIVCARRGDEETENN